jgi:deoxyribodipyrimidine photolyase
MCGYKPAVSTDDIQAWRLNPTLWGSGFQDTWRPGEAGAWETMDGFLEGRIEKYAIHIGTSLQGILRLGYHLTSSLG